MPKRFPPLTTSEVVSILNALGLRYAGSKGGHDFYKGVRGGAERKVTVDPKQSPFDDFLLRSMVSQAGSDRDEFYRATKKTAKKIQ
jgi:predicted RNA binding protein YcfA (HicA-like mRNA interferase family)